MISSRWCAAVVLAISLAAAGPVDAAGQEPAQRLPPAYLTALSYYRAGDLSAAFGKLNELSTSDLSDITRRLIRPDAAWDSSWPRLLTAAIMLHTEAFFIRTEAHPAPAFDSYIR